MITIDIWRDPYDTGVSLTRTKQIELQEGLTVLVGCNGTGKTTLLRNIEDYARDNKIPCHLWDNLSSGGSDSIGELLAFGNTPFAVSIWTASEGEAIKLNLGKESSLYKEFFKSGHFKNRSYNLSSIFSDKLKEDIKDNRRILLFDAVDSGLSVDGVIEIKTMFNTMIQDAKEMGLELYLIISANEYELARGENCFNVTAGKYITFSDYEDYRNFIIKSRAYKEKRLMREDNYKEKRRLKEIEKTEILIDKIKVEIDELSKLEKNSFSWRLDDKKSDLKRAQNKLSELLETQAKYEEMKKERI